MTDAEFRDAAKRAVLAAIASAPPPQDQMALIEDFLAGERGRESWYGMDAPGGSPQAPDNGLFRLGKKEPEPGEEPSDNLWLFNTYIRLGGSWIAMNGNTEMDTGYSAEELAGQFLYLYSYSMSTHGPDFSVSYVDSFAAIEQYSCDPVSIVIPLYHFDENGAVDMDFRIGVGTDAFDLMPIESTQEEQT